MTPLLSVVDHLLLGVSDLDRGIQWVDARTGVRPAIGGRHPSRGTQNALLSLGPTRYLEVIAPDPTQDTYTLQIDVRALSEPRLITWAAVSSDIDAVARAVTASGREVMGPFDGSRARPDGKVLKWRTLGISNNLAAGAVDPIPFFIQWAPGTSHPAADSPHGCSLEALRFVHPAAAGVIAVLKAIGIEANVSHSSEAAIYATLSTPKGVVELR
jgi:Glyoxalase-like domain